MKKIMLGTSDAWAKSRLYQQNIKPAYYIVDCLIFRPILGQLVVQKTAQPNQLLATFEGSFLIFKMFVASALKSCIE
jgi:hypothetical protein